LLRELTPELAISECYTINGLELVRVSVVNHKLQPVYETLVKPHQQVLDYNTRWSGITEHQLQDCNITIEDVQKLSF
jgi:RNA exonuclease 1